MFYCCCVSNWAGKGLQNTQGWMVKSVISACKSLEEEICQIALLLLFLIHHTHLGFSGGCHTIEYGAIAYQNMLIHAQLSGIFGIEMGQKNFCRKTQTDEGQTCDKLTPDGHLLLRFR